MTDSFENLIDIIIAILIIFILPFMLINQHKDLLVQVYVEEKVSSFSETVATNAYISRSMYEELNESINRLLPKHKIVIEHGKRTYYLDYKNEDREYFAKGETRQVFDNIYTARILEEIYIKNVHYYFNNGDYLRIMLIGDENFTSFESKQVIKSKVKN